MKTKKKNNKKVSPSVLFIVPIMICLAVISVYSLDTYTTLERMDNLTLETVSSRYGKLVTIKNYNEDNITKYLFYSETPYVEPIVFEEEKHEETVINTPSVIEVSAPTINVSAELEAVLNNNGMSAEEFYTIVAIVASEGGGSYTDAYAVANTLYNRTLCSRWVNYANSLGLNGYSMYGQAVLPNQYTVYQSGSYLNHMYETGTNAYNAVFTLLSTHEVMHNYMSFRSASSGAQGVQFIDGGNIYFSPID